MPVETLWHNSSLKSLIRTMFAARLELSLAGISCHPVRGFLNLQIVQSSKCNSVMSNVFESGGLREAGNNVSHWSSNFTQCSSLSRLLFNTCFNVAGRWTECKILLRTCVPPSTTSPKVSCHSSFFPIQHTPMIQKNQQKRQRQQSPCSLFAVFLELFFCRSTFSANVVFKMR